MVSMQLMKMPDESLVITFSDRSEEGIQGMMEQLHNLTEMIGEDGELTPEEAGKVFFEEANAALAAKMQ